MGSPQCRTGESPVSPATCTPNFLPVNSPAPHVLRFPAQDRWSYILQPQPTRAQFVVYPCTLLIHPSPLTCPTLGSYSFLFLKLPFCGSLWIISLFYKREPWGILVMSVGSEVRLPEFTPSLTTLPLTNLRAQGKEPNLCLSFLIHKMGVFEATCRTAEGQIMSSIYRMFTKY